MGSWRGTRSAILSRLARPRRRRWLSGSGRGGERRKAEVRPASGLVGVVQGCRRERTFGGRLRTRHRAAGLPGERSVRPHRLTSSPASDPSTAGSSPATARRSLPPDSRTNHRLRWRGHPTCGRWRRGGTSGPGDRRAANIRCAAPARARPGKGSTTEADGTPATRPPVSPYNDDGSRKPPVPDPFKNDYPIPGDPDYQPDAPSNAETGPTSSSADNINDPSPGPDGSPDQELPAEDNDRTGEPDSQELKERRLSQITDQAVRDAVKPKAATPTATTASKASPPPCAASKRNSSMVTWPTRQRSMH